MLCVSELSGTLLAEGDSRLGKDDADDSVGCVLSDDYQYADG